MKIQIAHGQIIGGVKPPDGFYNLTKYVKRRTNPQNAYLHAVILPLVADRMSEMAGKKISRELAKELLKYKFLTVGIPTVGTIVKPTSKLTTTEWDEFIMKVQQYGAEKLGIYLPDPNEG